MSPLGGFETEENFPTLNLFRKIPNAGELYLLAFFRNFDLMTKANYGRLVRMTKDSISNWLTAVGRTLPRPGAELQNRS